MSRRFATLAIIFVALAVAAPAMAQDHGEAAGGNAAIPWGMFAPALAIGSAPPLAVPSVRAKALPPRVRPSAATPARLARSGSR